MKLAYLAVMGALSAIGAGPSLMHQGAVPVEPVAFHSRMDMDTESYQLRVVGQEQACSVVLRDDFEGGLASLDVAPSCARLFDRLSEAHFWREEADGDILFVADDGRTIAQFFPGDGVAYESLKPVMPLMMLTEL